MNALNLKDRLNEIIASLCRDADMPNGGLCEASRVQSRNLVAALRDEVTGKRPKSIDPSWGDR
jgi:hypothetical protein